MPYIITTTEDRAPDWPGRQTRRAVATLDEARETVGDTLRDRNLYVQADGDYSALGDACASLPADGGTVGPLPDGTMIEVAPMEWRGGPITSDAEARAIVDAYNAQVTA